MASVSTIRLASAGDLFISQDPGTRDARIEVEELLDVERIRDFRPVT